MPWCMGLRGSRGRLLLHPSSRCRLVLKVAQSSAESGMSVLVRRLNLVRRHRLASQLRRELRVRLRVLVVTSTRVVVHGPRPACAAEADRVEGAVALPRDRQSVTGERNAVRKSSSFLR